MMETNFPKVTNMSLTVKYQKTQVIVDLKTMKTINLSPKQETGGSSRATTPAKCYH